MESKSSPWVKRFYGTMDRDVVRKRAERLPDPLSDLLTQPAHLGRASLEKALKGMILLADFELDHVMRLVERAHAYTVGAYPGIQNFLATVHSEEILTDYPSPVCLCGLAGVGKSALLNAVQNALPDPCELDLGDAIVGRMLKAKSVARIKVDAGFGFSELLKPWLPEELQQPKTSRFDMGDVQQPQPKVRNILSTLVARARRFSYRSGLCLSMADEWQFLTQGSAANSHVTKCLLMMSYIRVPLVYGANYSLCQKLDRRNQEDKDRLLADVIILRPLAPTEVELGAILRAYDRILGPCVDGSLTAFLAEYASMTLGIRRKISNLTVGAYSEMRERGDTKIKAEHLKAAFESKASASSRKDVASLIQQHSTGKKIPGKPDLWCPFGDEHNRLDLLPGRFDAKTEKMLAELFLRQSLTLSERNMIASVEHPSKSEPSKATQSEKENKGVGKKVPSAIDLLKNTVAHAKSTTEKKKEPAK